MLKPGLNIIVGVHPLGFKGLIACMLDVGFADDMGGMPAIEGMFIVDDDSDAYSTWRAPRSLNLLIAACCSLTWRLAKVGPLT